MSYWVHIYCTLFLDNLWPVCLKQKPCFLHFQNGSSFQFVICNVEFSQKSIVRNDKRFAFKCWTWLLSHPSLLIVKHCGRPSKGVILQNRDVYHLFLIVVGWITCCSLWIKERRYQLEQMVEETDMIRTYILSVYIYKFFVLNKSFHLNIHPNPTLLLFIRTRTL